MKIFSPVVIFFLWNFGFHFLECNGQIAKRDQETPRDIIWLKSHDLGNRYEGNYSKRVSSGVLELVSLTGQFDKYSFGKGQELNFRFFNPKKKKFHLKLEELHPHSFYWGEWKSIKPKKKWNECSPWPVDLWLRRLYVDPSNLGILLRLGEK